MHTSTFISENENGTKIPPPSPKVALFAQLSSNRLAHFMSEHVRCLPIDVMSGEPLCLFDVLSQYICGLLKAEISKGG